MLPNPCENAAEFVLARDYLDRVNCGILPNRLDAWMGFKPTVVVAAE